MSRPSPAPRPNSFADDGDYGTVRSRPVDRYERVKLTPSTFSVWTSPGYAGSRDAPKLDEGQHRPAVREAAMGTAEKGEEYDSPPTAAPEWWRAQRRPAMRGAQDDGALDDDALDIAAVCCLVAAHFAQVWGEVAP